LVSAEAFAAEPYDAGLCPNKFTENREITAVKTSILGFSMFKKIFLTGAEYGTILTGLSEASFLSSYPLKNPFSFS
jgi:hypothetical protein